MTTKKCFKKVVTINLLKKVFFSGGIFVIGRVSGNKQFLMVGLIFNMILCIMLFYIYWKAKETIQVIISNLFHSVWTNLYKNPTTYLVIILECACINHLLMFDHLFANLLLFFSRKDWVSKVIRYFLLSLCFRQTEIFITCWMSKTFIFTNSNGQG